MYESDSLWVKILRGKYIKSELSELFRTKQNRFQKLQLFFLIFLFRKKIANINKFSISIFRNLKT
jgi:hypothetical protein